MTSAVILEELRSGPKTTSELVAATGGTRDAVRSAIAQLGRHGHVIVNDRPRQFYPGGLLSGPGPHDDALYRLALDIEHPDKRTCFWVGCTRHLNRYNAGPWCEYHRGALARLVLACIDARPDAGTEVTADGSEQLALV